MSHLCKCKYGSYGSWWATVHGVTKSQTGLSNIHFHFQEIVKDRGSWCAAVRGAAKNQT